MLSYPFEIPKVNTYEKLSIEGKVKNVKKSKNDGYNLLYWFLN